MHEAHKAKLRVGFGGPSYGEGRIHWDTDEPEVLRVRHVQVNEKDEVIKESVSVMPRGPRFVRGR